ncbi:hypothetical protein WN51_12785 [Melipona quadrifasciata]|uniref:Uncharacterized protein n=1 Tax=Melipona quadrifasciata TaxID=166423 RepID=A0A0M9A3B8_9HYME|nr:hypothetical protein WN51_12785 [Melipona quadrifasciata]
MIRLTTSPPFLATKTHKLAFGEEVRYSRAAATFKLNPHLDNLITGADMYKDEQTFCEQQRFRAMAMVLQSSRVST